MSPAGVISGLVALVVAGLCLVLSGAYLYPPTRSLVRKWGWAVGAIVLTLLIGVPIVLLRGAAARRRPSSEDWSDLGSDVLRDTVDKAIARSLEADVELGLQRAAARELELPSAELDNVRGLLEKARTVEDPEGRRLAMLVASERSKQLTRR